MFKRFLSKQPLHLRSPLFVISILVLTMGLGCQAASDHPWKADAYAPPSKHKPLPKSTYAPIPSILPSVEGPDHEAPDEVGADDLEQVLKDLDIQ